MQPTEPSAQAPSDRGTDEPGTTTRPRSSEFTSEPVAAAMAGLDTLPQRPLLEHPDVYQQIHTDLQRALADIDDA